MEMQYESAKNRQPPRNRIRSNCNLHLGKRFSHERPRFIVSVQPSEISVLSARVCQILGYVNDIALI